MPTSPVGQFPAPPGRFLPAKIASLLLTTLCHRGFSPAKIPGALALLLTLLGLFVLVAPRTLRFNVTPSLPLGFYRLVGGPVERGSLVEICLPPGLTSLALHRGYSGKGSCPGDARPLLKTVLALPGDRLVLTRLGIARHGDLLPFSASLTADSKNRPLPRLPLGLYEVPPGSIWLYAPRPHSFDSRYFGPVSTGLLRNTVAPLLTAP